MTEIKDHFNKYIKLGLIDPSTNISTDIIEEDIDYNNIVGYTLLFEKIENSLFYKDDDSRYIQYLEDLMIDFSDLFFYADIKNKSLYFECLMGSKMDSNKKYLRKSLIYKVKTSNCPGCNLSLKIKPIGNIPVKIDGKTHICERFLVYCPECDGSFGILGFKATMILMDLFLE